MWQAPNQRMRAIANAKRRERERHRRPIHIKRVHAELKLVATALGKPAEVTQARVLLNDMSPHGVGVFSPSLLNPGQEVQITIEVPKRFFIRGKVIWCQEYDAESHILSEKSYSFRVGIEFIFQNAEEEQSVKDYCQELAREHLYAAVKRI